MLAKILENESQSTLLAIYFIILLQIDVVARFVLCLYLMIFIWGFLSWCFF